MLFTEKQRFPPLFFPCPPPTPALHLPHANRAHPALETGTVPAFIVVVDNRHPAAMVCAVTSCVDDHFPG